MSNGIRAIYACANLALATSLACGVLTMFLSSMGAKSTSSFATQFTTCLAAIVFGSIGALGLTVARTLKVMQKRLETLEQRVGIEVEDD
jgi:hypothetical protein